jgi:hypothetical protein
MLEFVSRLRAAEDALREVSYRDVDFDDAAAARRYMRDFDEAEDTYLAAYCELVGFLRVSCRNCGSVPYRVRPPSSTLIRGWRTCL